MDVGIVPVAVNKLFGSQLLFKKNTGSHGLNETKAPMDFFASNEDVEKMEAALLLAPQDHALQLELAWALRQRDSQRASAMADSLRKHVLTPAQSLRLDLMQAEALGLDGKLLESEALAQQVLQGFMDLQDDLGCADANWQLAWVVYRYGDVSQRQHFLQSIINNCKDATRRQIAEVTIFLSDAFQNLNSVGLDGETHSVDSASCHVAVSCVIQNLRGWVAAIVGDEVTAISHWHRAYTEALASGQIARAITIADNIGESFANLHEYHTALAWQQTTLQLARRSNWRATLGVALLGCGDVLRRVGRLELASEMLDEAQTYFESNIHSRDYGGYLAVAAEIAIDRGEFDQALATFQQLEALARQLRRPDLISAALCGQAKALSELGLAEVAQKTGLAALAQATSITYEKIPALLALAAIHVRHALPLPPSEEAQQSEQKVSSAALHYLLRALSLASEVRNYIVPGYLFDAIAEEYARLGYGMLAYSYAKNAAQARAKIYNNDAEDRAQALQSAYNIEKNLITAETNKRIAAEQAERAEQLLKANETLRDLGSIGKQITQHLDAERVFAVLEDYLARLLDADVLVIYMLKQGQLESVFDIERGQRQPKRQLSLDNPDWLSVRCLQQGSEIVCEYSPEEALRSKAHIPGTLVSLCAIFAPLRVAETTFGVMTIQSSHRQSYDTRAQMIFNTLCAYTAIALSNCNTHADLAQAHLDLDAAHRHLQETQQHLIHQEKMASLGQLIANVAHEINTPITTMKNNSSLINTALQTAFLELPNLLRSFSAIEHDLFVRLFELSLAQSRTLSTREERALTRETTTQLQAAGITHSAQLASLLVQLHVHQYFNDYLPLLQRENGLQILQALLNLTSIYFNANGIETAVRNVSKIVYALKSFSRLEQAGEFQLVPLQAGLETVLTLYHNQIKKGTELVCEFANIPYVECLPDELNQVWTNLIHNALQAMQYRGRLTIEIRQQGEEAVVAVSDTGCGIPSEHYEKIFNPFFTTKAIGEGSGLGLDIVKKIIAKHQGRIGFVSEVGVGTTFSVYLPIQSNQRAAVDAA